MPRRAELPSIELSDTFTKRLAGYWGKEGSFRIARTGSHTLRKTPDDQDPRTVPYYKLFASLNAPDYIPLHLNLGLKSERSTIWTITNRKAEWFLSTIAPQAILRRKQMDLAITFQQSKRERATTSPDIEKRLEQEAWFNEEMKRLRAMEELDELPECLTEAHFPMIDGLFHAALTPEPVGGSHRSRLSLRNPGFLKLLKARFGGSLSGIDNDDEIEDETEGEEKVPGVPSIKSYTWYVFGPEMDRMFEELYPEYVRGLAEGFPRDLKREAFFTKIIGVGFEQSLGGDEVGQNQSLIQKQLDASIAEITDLRTVLARLEQEKNELAEKADALSRTNDVLQQKLQNAAVTQRTLETEVSNLRAEVRRLRNSKSAQKPASTSTGETGSKALPTTVSVSEKGKTVLAGWTIEQVDQSIAQVSQAGMDHHDLPLPVEQTIVAVLIRTGQTSAKAPDELSTKDKLQGLQIIRNAMLKNKNIHTLGDLLSRLKNKDSKEGDSAG